MDFIRLQKARADYDPNQRHCLYGLDADLIMLSLVSHEPHFVLLREEVTFGRRPSKGKDAHTPVRFQLLYINLLRECFDEEFKMELPYGYDLERVIDDFILMCFFVGT
jgi:5'-3' exoribonuclease 1